MAKADKLGMRHSGRPTVRPVYPRTETSPSFGVGDAVDAWWSDGWWEGVVFDTNDGENGIYQIYIPGLVPHCRMCEFVILIIRENKYPCFFYGSH